jgi:citrate lyase synthetase
VCGCVVWGGSESVCALGVCAHVHACVCVCIPSTRHAGHEFSFITILANSKFQKHDSFSIYVGIISHNCITVLFVYI